MEKTWMPTVAGILDIVAAVFKLMGVFVLIIVIIVAEGVLSIGGVWIPMGVGAILWAIVIPLAMVSILSLVGGIYALQRKKWGLALAGSIAAFLPSSLLGALAIIFTALSKKEFE